MEKVCGIYCITNMVNSKKYIGQSVDIYTRWANHKSALKHNRHDNEHLQNAWNTYGEQNFIFEILEICDIDKIDNIEKKYIELFNTMNRAFGYNNESGGHKNKSLSEQSRQKISEKHKGKKLSDETKKKIGAASKGRVLSDEARNKIRTAITGIERSEETRKRISDGRSGENSWRRRAIYCMELDETFLSIQDAQQKYGFNGASLCSHLKGRYKWSGKHPVTGQPLHWIYTDDLSAVS